MSTVDKDNRILAEFIKIYCSRQHKEAPKEPWVNSGDFEVDLGIEAPPLCADCSDLLSYSVARRAHCHQTSDEEVALLAKSGMRYVSCPASIGVIDGITPPLALYLASGGVSAGIGSDQASGNNHHNMLVEMKVAALLNKCRHTDPTVLPAWKMLRIATVEGAETIGLGDSIGSLEPGKKADLIILNLKVPHMMPIITTPVPNVAPNIVYSARGDEVETVIIDGEIVIRNHEVLTMDEEKVMDDAQKASTAITESAAEDFFKADSYLAKAVKKGLL